MPHKRAKRSVREQRRSEETMNQAPKASNNDDTPRSMSRVLNAEKIQKEWKSKRKIANEKEEGTRKKRKVVEEPEALIDSKAVKIRPGESLPQFNRRVEMALAPALRIAMRTSAAHAKAAATAKADPKSSPDEAKTTNETKIKSKPTPSKSDTQRKSQTETGPEDHDTRPREFQTYSSSAPKRLNDIAQAPPEFKKLPRKAPPKASSGPIDIVSQAQKRMMELERDKVIQRYRALKEGKRKLAASRIDSS